MVAKLVALHRSAATQSPLLTVSTVPSVEMDGWPPEPPDGFAVAAARMAVRKLVMRTLLAEAVEETASTDADTVASVCVVAVLSVATALDTAMAWVLVCARVAVICPLAVVDSAAICDDSVQSCDARVFRVLVLTELRAAWTATICDDMPVLKSAAS